MFFDYNQTNNCEVLGFHEQTKENVKLYSYI